MIVKHVWLIPAAILALGLAKCSRADDAAAVQKFEKRVRPLLVERCHKCHSGDKVKGGLRLESAASLGKGGDSGPVVVPGKPDESLLIQAVRQENDLKMPPPPDVKLSDAQIADLVEWVKAGAKWPADDAAPVTAAPAEFSPEERAHWAYQPVRDVAPPDVRDASWATSPIDRFILAKLEAQSLTPAPPADRRTLLRRVTFDLTGLPPTPEEVDAFLADESPQAFESAVNRLLDSPHYGERQARHWLDVVRYAETTANDANAVMRYAWRYRDYVIDAFNRDVSYDQFLIEQLAGDLLPPTDVPAERVRRTIATGFLMIGPKALAETDKEQSRLDIVDDQLDVTGRALLGMTIGCARCHDHKFDAIRALDYYALAGIFRSTEPFQDEARNNTMFWEFPIEAAPGQPIVVMAPKETDPRNLRIHLRGNRFTLGAVAPRGALSVISPGPLQIAAGSGRLELARWIANPDNPLTARVMVNRLWQQHFGRGLVATSDNFGTRGERPSHPELLDFLAARFVQSGWSLKSLHRLIVLSSTYRQAAPVEQASSLAQNSSPALDPGLKADRLDPDNRLLWHFPRRRLSAEELRDAALAASGRLDRSPGGSDSSDILWKEAEIQDAKRGFAPNRMPADHPFYTDYRKRSVYLPVVRNMLPDVLTLFDAADPNGVTAVRNETTVPSQSLFLMNSRFLREQSRHFAERLLAQTEVTDEQRMHLAHVLAFSRPASADEESQAREFIAACAAPLIRPGLPESEKRLAAWQAYCHTLLCVNEFLYCE